MLIKNFLHAVQKIECDIDQIWWLNPVHTEPKWTADMDQGSTLGLVGWFDWDCLMCMLGVWCLRQAGGFNSILCSLCPLLSCLACPSMPLSKMPVPMGGSGLASTTWFFGPTSPHHLDWFIRYCRAHSYKQQTDQPTADHATPSLAIGCNFHAVSVKHNGCLSIRGLQARLIFHWHIWLC